MIHTIIDSRRWARQGTDLLIEVVDGLGCADYSSPSALPGWTNGHVIAHVAANADALGNLVQWAASGEVSPMYTSPGEREAMIAKGAELSAADLRAWLRSAAVRLEKSMDELSDDQWAHPVVTAQGRTVPASTIAWLRAREVFVHAVDLAGQVTFADLPEDFLRALIEDIRTKRGGDLRATGPLPDVAAWLAGRPHSLNVPSLGPWL